MATCTNFHYSFAQPFFRQMIIHWKKRVSRKAAKAQAKEEENELRQSKLCVSAPLREILLDLPEVICWRALRHSREICGLTCGERHPSGESELPCRDHANFSLAVAGRFCQGRVVRLV
jgi:hypothetical protein